MPIYLAALGDASTRLAGELGDAWVPFLYPWSQLTTGLARLREGAARGGHPDRVPTICPSVPVVVAEDEAKAREGAAWFVAFYLTTMGTIYRDSLTRQRYGKAVEAVLAANAPKFAGAVPRDADDLLEPLIVFGTPPPARRCRFCCCARTWAPRRSSARWRRSARCWNRGRGDASPHARWPSRVP
jgi:alkanesulfonate monooxygenase SsuD/methylene tetrahydromethanopterin reductase-like flavin-dependent oxidoreductase (luciferase family)